MQAKTDGQKWNIPRALFMGRLSPPLERIYTNAKRLSIGRRKNPPRHKPQRGTGNLTTLRCGIPPANHRM